MKWQHPPIIKIYEALGAVADGRIDVLENTAKVYSSSRNKWYDVVYDETTGAIMTNDNGSYWKEYLGYPSIAFFFVKGILPYDARMGELLKGIKWKDINQEFKNDFDKTLAHIESSLSSPESEALAIYVRDIDTRIATLAPDMFGKKILPPEGY
ncbi:MAG: hypothetical protein HGB03_02805 [Candidatus Yonathbacteria bacterium]|nr:hypothetical protein [Candidatus Yonathbacteria bacterium]NTW47435.1 hypothetical protein [Candidatus Yonathbacteria bacterium]